jgi:hypothetical protein
VTVTPNAKGTGTHNITASYPGSQVHTASSGSSALTVNTRTTTTTVVLAPNAVDVNQSSTATVTVTDVDKNGTALTPTGIVAVTSDSGDTITGTCTLGMTTTGVATCQVTVTPNGRGTGTHNITASYPGSQVHTASSSSAALTVSTRHTISVLSFSRNSTPVTAADVNQGTTVTLTVTDDDKNGTAETPKGTISFSSATGSDSFNPDTCILSGSGASASCSVILTAASANPGSHAITGTFSPDDVHSGSNNPQSIAVNTRHTTSAVTFSASANTVAIATQITLTATVTDDDANGSPETPIGTVTFAFGNGTDKASGGTCSLQPTPMNGAAASCTLNLTAANVGGGAHTVSISYPTDTVHTGGNGNSTLTVIPAQTATKIISVSNVQNFLGQSAGLTATVQNVSQGSAAAPTGSVQFLLDGNPLGSPAVLVGMGTTSTATITDDLTKLTAGSHTITAQYVPDQVLGSQNFVKSDSGASGAGSNDVAITVAPTINNIPGQTITPVQLQINGTGFTGQATFTCSVQLAGNPIPPTVQTNFPICALDHTSGALPATVTATITTVAQSSGMASPAFSNPAAPRVAALYGLSTSLAGVLGLMVLGDSRRRKYWSRRKLVTLLGLMLVLAVLLLAVGCGGGGFNNPNNLKPAINGSTQQGQYVVSVIGTDSNGNTVAIAAIPVNVQL